MRIDQTNWPVYRELFIREMRKRSASVVMLALLLLAGFGCSSAEVPPVPAAEEEQGPVQFGVPFENVPNTADVAMYEVNLRAFSASGDLKGVQARLDEIKNLGINVIWLMPIYPTGDLKSVGSPYAVKDYLQVNPDYGSLADLRSLVQEAHARDMAVILDWVANHTAWDHPWIKNPSWYTRDASGNIISPLGMGWNDVADLNYSNQEMRQEMIKALKYWILEANVDGYRFDHAEGVPLEFWKQAIDTLRSIPNRDLILFAEAANKDMFTAGFDLIFGWNFYSRLKEVYNNGASATTLAIANAADYTSVPAGAHILRWIDNHDDNAWKDTPINIFKGQQGALTAFVITAYMGGVPLIYNGQEIGYTRRLSFFEGNSTKIDWSVNPDIRAEYERLMTFRGGSNAVKGGAIEAYSATDVVAFKRISGSEEVVVIANVRDRQVTYPLPGALTNTSWQHALSDEPVSFESSITLEPFSYLILKN